MNTGGWDAVADDWMVAQNVLQIVAEQGPGMAYAAAESAEDKALRKLAKLTKGG
jgi:hypothetical protein